MQPEAQLAEGPPTPTPCLRVPLTAPFWQRLCPVVIDNFNPWVQWGPEMWVSLYSALKTVKAKAK